MSRKVKRFIIRNAFLVFLTLLLIFVLQYLLLKKEPSYVALGAPGFIEHKVVIPEEIVKAKDCKGYYEWANTRPEFYHYPEAAVTCPWDNAPRGRIGKFIINGVKLNVPREYITFYAREPDGVIDGLALGMVYPEMRRILDAKEDFHNEISMFLRISNPKRDESIYHYYDLARVKKGSTTFETEKPFKEVGYIPELNATLYTTGFSEFYIQGDYRKPDYWLECSAGSLEGKDRRCESYFYINEKIYLHMRMSSRLLKYHHEIRQKVLEKFREWQQ